MRSKGDYTAPADMTIRKYRVSFSSGRQKIVEAYDARDAISQQILWVRWVLKDPSEQVLSIEPAPFASLTGDGVTESR